MRGPTKQKCWKCGQDVEYRFTMAWGGLGSRWFRRGFMPGGSVLAPIKHYVEKNGRFEVCKGSQAPHRTETERGNRRWFQMRKP